MHTNDFLPPFSERNTEFPSGAQKPSPAYASKACLDTKTTGTLWFAQKIKNNGGYLHNKFKLGQAYVAQAGKVTLNKIKSNFQERPKCQENLRHATYGSLGTNDETIFMDEVLENDGINVNKKNRHGYTALFIAVWNNDINYVKRLLEKGADINLPCMHALSNRTPLLLAALMRNREMVLFLVNSGADINIPDSKGKTLHQFPYQNIEEYPQYYLENGSSDLQRNENGECNLEYLKNRLKMSDDSISDFRRNILFRYAENIKPNLENIQWGGEIEIAVLEKFFNVEIIIKNDSTQVTPCDLSTVEVSTVKPKIELYYDGMHYQYIHSASGEYIDVPADGNCLFHAISQGINQLIERKETGIEEPRTKPLSYKKLRRIVSKMLLDEGSEFAEIKKAVTERFDLIFNAESIEQINDLGGTLGQCDLFKRAKALKVERIYLDNLYANESV